MHELSIVQALVERVEAEAARVGAQSVRRLEVSIGELSGVEPELLSRAWETFREASICAGATMEIRHVAACWSCPRCEAVIGAGSLLRCPTCEVPARLSAGGDIMLERVEMEVPDV